MRKAFVIGDIHGAHRALVQCLERSEFDYQSDTLICLGDVCDGWPDTKKCIDELLKINNLIYIIGNHDRWALQWMLGEYPGEIWAVQGGDATVKSYGGVPLKSHADFLEKAFPYFIMEGKLFVHAGINPNMPVEKQTLDTLTWDRELAAVALELKSQNREKNLTLFSEVYIGHTPIHRIGFQNPTKACEIWLMDTGAGWDGCLSIMNIETEEYFTSDVLPKLYPEDSGRF